jgi:hypothetical protein
MIAAQPCVAEACVVVEEGVAALNRLWSVFMRVCGLM